MLLLHTLAFGLQLVVRVFETTAFVLYSIWPHSEATNTIYYYTEVAVYILLTISTVCLCIIFLDLGE